MIRIGTRASRLARVQAESVRTRLQAAYPGETFEVVPVTTQGDRVTDRPVADLGGSAVFTSELERALLAGEVDMAVHSLKDLPSVCAEGLVLAKAWPRADPRDALVARSPRATLADLPRGARVATDSPRRRVQLKRLRPDLTLVSIRGNVDTRLARLFSPTSPDEPLDALVLAAAGLERLGRTDAVSAFLSPGDFIPAANQGQLGLELRAGDAALKAKVDALGSDAADRVARAERGFLREIGADCHAPVGAFAQETPEGLALSVLYAPDETTAPAFARVVAATPDDAAFRAAAAVRRQLAGEVALVGAGPGDPELITVKGMKALHEADAVVYDRLVGEALLGELKPTCVRVYVGKASGAHTLPQDEINATLVRLAMAHRHVVRLKGGDPCVFGRGGEEAAYLEERGVPFCFVPGVTSAIAAAESAHIPVTHRGVAEGVAVVTAHGRAGAPLSIDFARLADAHLTCVFLMGLSRVGELAASLVAAGRSAATPAAVIASATMPDAHTVVGTLADIGSRSAGLASPAVLVVGEVVALRRALGLPLSGRRLLVPTIGGNGPSRLVERLRALGAEVIAPEVGRIEFLANALTPADLADATWLALTSRNGVFSLNEALLRVVRERAIRVAAIGAATATAAEERGLGVTWVDDVPTGTAFCADLAKRLTPADRVVHPMAEGAPDALAPLARVCGYARRDVYRNAVLPLTTTYDLGEYDAAVLTCASSARRLLASATGKTRLVAIGATTATALPAGAAVSVARAPSLDALVEAVITSP